MVSYGLKLWSTDKKLFKEAADLFKAGKADLVELYIVPNSFSIEDLDIFKGVKATLHAPHSEHDFNIFTLDEKKIHFFKDWVIKTADFLGAEKIVVHAGIGNKDEIFKKNVAKIYDKRIIIENKPKLGIGGEFCYGYSLKQLEFIRNECGLEICFDFVHAIKTAIPQKIDYKIFLDEIIKQLNPKYFHICDSNLDSEIDMHLNLGEGELDVPWIKERIENIASEKDINLIFEVPKAGGGLKNDLANIRLFKEIPIS